MICAVCSVQCRNGHELLCRSGKLLYWTSCWSVNSIPYRSEEILARLADKYGVLSGGCCFLVRFGWLWKICMHVEFCSGLIGPVVDSTK